MQDEDGEGVTGRKKKRRKRRRDRSLELDDEDFDLLEEQGIKVSLGLDSRLMWGQSWFTGSATTTAVPVAQVKVECEQRAGSEGGQGSSMCCGVSA